MIIDIEDVLNRLIQKNRICRSSRDIVTGRHGWIAEVSPRRLKAAIEDRGCSDFLTFFEEALDLPKGLILYLENLAYDIGRRAIRDPYGLVEKVYAAAIWAYVQEMDLP